MSDATEYTEEYKVEGDALVCKVKERVHEGNIRRITINNEGGKELIWARMSDPLGSLGSH